MSIGTFSVKNPVFVNVLMVSIFVLGFFSLTNLPREQFAEVPFFWVNITVPYPGVGSEDIENLITIPIETEMNGLKNLDEIQSTSSEGIGVVSIRFDSSISQAKFDTLFQEVRSRFSKVELPDGALEETIDAFSSNDFTPVIEVVLSGHVEYGTLLKTAEDIADELDRIRDVSEVQLIGVRDKRILIEVDRERSSTLGVTLNSIAAVLQRRNINVPAGNVKSENRDYLVRTAGEIKEADSFQDLIIRRGISDSAILHIKDVANVSEEYDENGVQARYNGQTAITLRVAKVPKGNSIAIVSSLNEIIKKWESRLSDDIEISKLNDSTVQIKSSLDVLVTNALMGLALLVVILFIFIGFRNAIMTALGIPITFALTVIVLDILGETFNSNTLFGLVLVLGLVVDHAIVIIENSYRIQQLGLSRRQAAIDGTNQVLWPVIAATATTVAAFLPLMLLPGTIGRFLRVIPLTVTIALSASTFEALFFLPSHYADWPGKQHKEKRQRFFKLLRDKYELIVKKLYIYRKRSVAVAITVMIGLFALTSTLKQDLFSAEDFSVFYINIEMPTGTTQTRTDETVRSFEQRLLPLIGNGEILAISSSIGFLSSGTGNSDQGNIAQILVDVTEQSDGRNRPISEIMSDIQSLTNDIPGPEKVFFKKAVNGPPQDPPLSFRLFGNDLNGLIEVTNRIRNELAAYPVLINIDDDISGGKPELKIIVNEERASLYGLNVFSIGQQIRAAVSGIEATTFVKQNTAIDVIVRYKDAYKFRADRLLQIKLQAPDGREIPFSAVADIVTAESPASIQRVDGRRVVTITADAYDNELLPEINETISKLVQDEYSLRYPDIELVVGGEFAEFDTLLLQILQIFLIGVFIIYLILGTQFKSYTQPLLILVSVPMAFAGVILYLFISGTPFSTTVLYAGVALAGIAVNDAIVLISFINELREKDTPTADAVVEAASTRLRPILLTSLTTIAGLLPTAVGLGGVSVVWQPMANTIIFGLLFSTLTALFLIPMLYGSFYDRKKA